MNRHVIVGRFGVDDKTAALANADEKVTNVDLVASERRLDHGLGRAMEDLAKLNIYPTELGLDVLVVAALVHAADTRISRTTESQDNWTRELRLVVPVSDVAKWESANSVLRRMLNFLSGDRWTIGFRPRPPRFKAVVRPLPRRLVAHRFNSVSLFSGGLDSLIGAIDLLESGNVPLLVSHAGEGAVSDSQNALFDSLKKHYASVPFERLRIWMNFPQGLVSGVGSEDTTRARSFLFIAAGIFAGTGLGDQFKLNVPENGLIALNVPLDPLRLGSLSTRTTHPFYLARWNELLGIIGIAGKVENPYWNLTKGEMAANCRNKALLKKVAAQSLSCSSPTKGRWQGHSTGHCGYCLPCLIRRAALKKGLPGFTDPTTYNLDDLSAHVLNTAQAEGQQVRSFQYAIERLRKKPALASLLIHKPGPLLDETPERQSELAGVYSRGLMEVGALLSGVRTAPS